MTNNKLLELAAKATQCEYQWFGANFHVRTPDKLWNIWNPLLDDGDAFRLAATLGLVVRINLRGNYSLAEYFINGREREFAIDHNTCADINDATRRAIVCAAAEIGKNMS